MTHLTYNADAHAITITAATAERGFLARLAGLGKQPSLEDITRDDWALSIALSDLRALAEDENEDAYSINDDSITLSHPLAAMLDAQTANALGLPPIIDLVFETSVAGVLGNPSFRLTYRWMRDGKLASPSRTGALIHTSDGDRRLSRPVLDAITIADQFDAGAPLADHWSALARFRQSLRPDNEDVDPETPPDAGARIEMMAFLDSLRIRSADAFSLSVRDDGDNGVTFDPAPFAKERLHAADDRYCEDDARLTGSELARFQSEFGRRGASNAYQLADNSYLVIERTAAPALEVMAQKQKASPEERAAFIANPTPAFAEAYEKAFEYDGLLAGESEAAQEALIGGALEGAFVETREYLSARVLGVGAWRPPDIGDAAFNPTTWLPELFSDRQRAAVEAKSLHELEALDESVKAARDGGQSHIDIGDGVSLPANPATSALIADALGDARQKQSQTGAVPEDENLVDGSEAASISDPVVIQTKTNFDSLTYGPELRPRESLIEDMLPETVTATLMDHQSDSFSWQIAAWRAGVPGLLNADEPGLGKTLQTLSFLAWLRKTMATAPIENRLPILIVAPTTLLENWEKEVGIHLDENGLGFVERLYGSGLSARKRHGTRGKDTDDGEARLDFGTLEEAIREGRGHGRWLLTTYQTLTNYQHSFSRLRFSAVVFDEIQAIKNPATLGAEAVRSVAADFRIGLTGTPVENRLTDLWAIMDQLAPGTLASLTQFRRHFEPPATETMEELHARVFAPTLKAPPLGIRRLKTDVAADLPPKQRLLHPRVMPPVQAEQYLEAHEKATSSPRGGALKALQHIRSVSAHPGGQAGDSDTDFVDASARMSAAIEILHWIKSRNERALIFIEHTKLQHRFAEIVRRVFDLDDVPIINGKTPPKKRQPIVDHFQRHLKDDAGFDALILAPRAAGTGLTLTAACHVIHLSRWWNPAVEEQCNDRTHRIGQVKPVTVHLPMAVHPDYINTSFDCLLHDLMRQKRDLASAALWPAADSPDDIGEMMEKMSTGRDGLVSTALPDGASLQATGAALGLTVEALGEGTYILSKDPRSQPLEVKLQQSATNWALGNGAAARIAFGSAPIGKRDNDPPLTVLTGGLAALWPRHVIDT